MRTKKMLVPEGNREGTNWQKRCADLEVQCAQLQKRVAELEAERDRYLKAVYALTYKDFDIDDKEALLAQARKGPSLEEVIASLKSDRS